MQSEILNVLDTTAVEILAATSGGPVSVETIHERSGVPTSTLYRRLDRLVDAGLLRSTPKLSEENSNFFVYECLLEELRLTVEAGNVSVTATFRNDDTDEPASWCVGSACPEAE